MGVAIVARVRCRRPRSRVHRPHHRRRPRGRSARRRKATSRRPRSSLASACRPDPTRRRHNRLRPPARRHPPHRRPSSNPHPWRQAAVARVRVIRPAHDARQRRVNRHSRGRCPHRRQAQRPRPPHARPSESPCRNRRPRNGTRSARQSVRRPAQRGACVCRRGRGVRTARRCSSCSERARSASLLRGAAGRAAPATRCRR